MARKSLFFSRFNGTIFFPGHTLLESTSIMSDRKDNCVNEYADNPAALPAIQQLEHL